MTKQLSNFIFNDVSNEYDISFELHNSHPSLANAIRRIILSDVQTLGFKTEPLEESEINIIKNSSSLHNEFLLHRLGMIPVHYPNIKQFNPNRYKFILDVTNDTSQIRDITTKDIQVIDLELNDGEGGRIDSEDFFPKNPNTKEYILITKLKPNLEGEGEKIQLEAKAMIGSGKLNSRWQPTSCAVYFNKKDDAKVREELQKFLNLKKIEYGDSYEAKKDSLENEFNISESERYFLVDENNTPNTFVFNIESIGVIKSHLILIDSLNIINSKLIELNKNMTILKQKDSINNLEFTESKTVMNAFDITIHNENHTLGFLIQTYIISYFEKDLVSFIGYNNPHPLKDFIVIRISVPNHNKDTALDYIIQCISLIQKDVLKLIDDTNSQFGIKKRTLKIKRK